MQPRLRPMHPDDLADLMAVQADCYAPAMVEPATVLQRRLENAQGHCWVVQDAEGVCAYAFGYPSRVGMVTRLGSDFRPAPDADCLYLHDVAVARRAKGKGLGLTLVRHVLAAAHQQRLRYSALVSVQESRSFWERLGYAAVETRDDAARDSLASYAAPALYMVQALDDAAA